MTAFFSLSRQAWIERHQRHAGGQVVAAPSEHLNDLVGESDAVLGLREVIKRLRDFDGNVIITGEPGSGKEVVARCLRRRKINGETEPWVDVDSSTIQGTMAESILFGHERGAFTGADRRHHGLFEQATGGTVYLDEIANMSLEVQAKLLRVLQEKRLTRVGSIRSVDVDFRVISATNRSLAALCRRGQFRFDLYTRLDTFCIEIPPLRSRRDDVPLLAEHFLRQRSIHSEFAIHPSAMDLLINYSWPGNVRELSNAIQHMLVMSNGCVLDQTHLPPKISCYPQSAHAPFDTCLRTQVKACEKRAIIRAIKRAGGNISDAARALKVDRSGLYIKMAEHGIKRHRNKASG